MNGKYSLWKWFRWNSHLCVKLQAASCSVAAQNALEIPDTLDGSQWLMDFFFDAIALLGNSLGACMLPVNQMHTWKCDFAFSHATGVMRREHSLLPPSAGIDDKQAHTTLKEKWVYFSFFLSFFARKLNLLAVSAGVVKLERKMQVENRAEERSWRCEHHEHDV